MMGSPLPQTSGAGLPPARFHCLLDEQPTHLLPERFLAEVPEDTDERQLFVNSCCHFSWDGQLPPELTGSEWLLESFALQQNMVWVRDPAMQALQPFWLGPEFSAWLAGLHPGDAGPADLPSGARRMLTLAQVLAPRDYLVKRSETWSAAVSHGAALFRQKGFAPFGRLIHPLHLAALRRYYRYLIRKGTLPLGDQQSSRRYVAHNESVARFFHQQLTAAVSQIVGEPVKPSYVYVASYQSGAELEKHTDREQCEFSITLCLDYSPEPRLETPWPLHLDTRSGKVTVFQGIGDGLLYRGRELPHYRDALPQGSTSTSIFFHYVRQEFAGPLD